MKKFDRFFSLIAPLITGILIVQPVIADTNVSGVISTNTVWNTAGSPYIVTGNLLVDTLATLTIQPGVEIRLDAAKYIMVKGILNAIGTAGDSIIITKNGSTGWKRLWLRPSAICSLKYCRIEYADTTGIYNDSGRVYIGYSTISNNSTSYSVGGGIRNSGIAIITNNTISGNSSSNVCYGGGGGIWNDSSATITNNIIMNNSAASGGGIFNDGSVAISYNTITNNSADGSGGGILNRGPAVITDNVISNNSVGSDFNGGGICNISASGTVTITHNTISNNFAANGGGIYDCYGISAIKYNTITDATVSAIYVSDNVLIRTNNISATGYSVHTTTTSGINIDARYNWWNITNTDTIDQKIYDYYDDFVLDKVLYQPFLNAPFSDTIAPSAPINLTLAKINDLTFEINWTNPVDISGISEYYYKLDSLPISDFDTAGTFHYPPDTITTTQQESLFVWLVDSSGNLNYNNRASIYLVGVEEDANINNQDTKLEILKNPFFKNTTIRYSISANNHLRLTIHDLSGRCVKTLVNSSKTAGSYSVNLDAKDFATGIYFITFTTADYKEIRKLVLMK